MLNSLTPYCAIGNWSAIPSATRINIPFALFSGDRYAKMHRMAPGGVALGMGWRLQMCWAVKARWAEAYSMYVGARESSRATHMESSCHAKGRPREQICSFQIRIFEAGPVPSIPLDAG